MRFIALIILASCSSPVFLDTEDSDSASEYPTARTAHPEQGWRVSARPLRHGLETRTSSGQ